MAEEIDDELNDELKERAADAAFEVGGAIVKGGLVAGLGLLDPIVGPMLAEVLGSLIPRQRIDRVERLLRRVLEKLPGLEEERLRARFHRPEYVDLLEDGIFQAARALTDERIEHIASVLENGITAEREDFLEHKTVLALLSELNDVEVILLRARARHPHEDEEFRQRHAPILEPKRAHMASSREELDEYTLREAHLAHLARLGLLRPHFKRPTKRGEAPEFDDKTGMMKASGYEVTPLGYLLLARIGLIAEDERP